MILTRTAPQFLFDFGSPNAYLSHLAIPAIEQRIGVKFEYVPILLGGIFKSTNNKSPAESLAGIRNKREFQAIETERFIKRFHVCLLYTSPSPRDGLLSRMPSSA